MISIGRTNSMVAIFQAIQQTSAKLATTVTQIPAGLLSAPRNTTKAATTIINTGRTDNMTISATSPSPGLVPNKYIFLISAVCPVMLFISTIITIRERRRKLNKNNFRQTFSHLLNSFKQRRFWILTVFLFIYSSCPQQKTSLFYYQRDHLKFTSFFISILNTIYNGCGCISALIYITLFSHNKVQRTLRIAIVLKMFALISYLFLYGRISSIIIAILTGLTSEITNLAILNLAARSCPPNLEGTLFALLVSCVNFGVALGDIIGSKIYEGMQFQSLVILSTVWIGLCSFGTCHVQEHEPITNEDEDDGYHYYTTSNDAAVND
ncbi:unnamed protein product [Didymodactylos carnosus]|uniref:Uncharacterized protein n=1 Tax=Didymodactylos carnosus TaxID=1234261 RepID=A0A815VI70_9BILA|nr:unnamed protein product [Didymodactylos carnosus]CAF1530789.1 unnamed protein product [Didymodactylos carnosus]CAF4199805.1 unnamed protein product [Didymodactylos carnosus]CAF4390015.1 unnamed protein product [Didymodactylos carnosus]